MTDNKREKALQAERVLKQLVERQQTNKLAFYKPYARQQEFHDIGSVAGERCFSAGNQLGKTYAGAAEVAMHLTGRYPDDWLGRRWDRPTRGWAAGVTGESTRDNPQRLLLGTQAEGHGTGLIPKDCLREDDMTLARGVSGLYDTILVKHKSGGKSELKFKSYERGREKWQGDTLDFIWFDEEPPEDIYDEGLARLTTTNGIAILTFTPLMGVTAVVKRFFDEPSATRQLVVMTVDDCPHMSPDKIAAAKSRYPRHQWQCRLYGQPLQGEGAIFTFLIDEVTCDAFPIPKHWAVLWGLDFGIQHPFAASLMAWDRDGDVIYIVATVRMKNALVLQHCAALKAAFGGRGNIVPAAWPQDGWQRKEFEGKLQPVVKQYTKLGQKMLPTHAAFADGSNSTEAGLLEMTERFATKRLRAFNHLTEWTQEYGRYHRKDGLIVKVDDDLMSATRVAIMAKRFAKPFEFLTGEVVTREGQHPVKLARGVDPHPWGF